MRIRMLSLLHEEDGQILPWMVFLMVLFIGMAGLTIDLGHAYVAHDQLQASTDAAALAGAYAMKISGANESSVDQAVSNNSSVSGATNANANLSSVSVSTTLRCVTDSTLVGAPCGASDTGDNVIQVTQSATVPTFFIRALDIFGVHGANSINLVTTSTATLVGAANKQYNVNLVVDSTGSMSSNDSDCGTTRINCALQGVQTLLASLSPCSTGSSKAAGCISPYDDVSIFTYPEVQANSAKYDNTCAKGNPTLADYTMPAIGATWSPTNYNSSTATYQITGYLTDYSSTNQPTSTTSDPNGQLYGSSALAIAAGAGSCTGIQATGGKGTYFAGAIYAAQSSLVAQQKISSFSNAQNAIVILSDGDAGTSSGDMNITGTVQKAGTGNPPLTVDYPSAANQCQQAIDAAKYATSQGTTVYVIAYGASNSGCSTDAYNKKSNPNGTGVTPCQTLQAMASTPADFYSDATASQNKGQCVSTSNPITKTSNLSTALDAIFQKIAVQWTFPRLIPNGTT